MAKQPDHVRLVGDIDELLAIRAQWDELFDASSSAAAPLRFEWIAQWWQHYGAVYGTDGGGLSILTVWDGGSLVGALPLYRRMHGRFVRHARLQFVSTGEAEFEETCPEYLDMLARPGEEHRVAAALRGALLSDAVPRWDDVVVADVAEGSSLLPAWQSGWTRGDAIAVEPLGTCPIANLDGGFESYLSRLSANTRQQARRMLRDAEKAGASLKVAATAAEIDASFEELVRLHQARWRSAGRAGCFAADRFTAFHRTLARQLVPRGEAVLAQLDVGGEPVAVLYGFVTRAKFDFYQSGLLLDGSQPLQRPGIVAHLKLMEHLTGRGVTRYDFLRGAATYKERLATEARPMFRLRVVRLTVRSALWATTHWTGRAVRKGVRMLIGYGGGKVRAFVPATQYLGDVGSLL